MEILKLEKPSLDSLGKDEFGMIGVAVFQAAIVSLCDFMGASWGDEQVAECGQLAYSEAHWFTLAELKLFTVRVKSAYYKSHKNFIPAVLMEWLREFIGEMLQARGEYYSKKQESKWVEPENPVSEERVSEFFNDLKLKLAANIEQEREIERQEREEKIASEQELYKKRLELIQNQPHEAHKNNEANS